MNQVLFGLETIKHLLHKLDQFAQKILGALHSQFWLSPKCTLDCFETEVVAFLSFLAKQLEPPLPMDRQLPDGD